VWRAERAASAEGARSEPQASGANQAEGMALSDDP
jgi:hypothetical protein